MPEEDNSILGDSVYQHLRYEERDTNNQPVDLKMFEQHQQNQQQEAFSQHQVDLESLNHSEYGDWSREDIYQSISRGQSVIILKQNTISVSQRQSKLVRV